jgi:dihydrofolate reductase
VAKIIVDITMSLDGFVTGPNPGPDNGLGDGGEVLHRWATESQEPIDERLLEASLARTGAVVMGRRTFDVVDGPHGWSDEAGFGGRRDGRPLPHNFVVTHRLPEHVRLIDDFTIVTGGLEVALQQAAAHAGDRDVTVMGGGDLCGQCIARGLADEVIIHLAPVVLGGGTRLFSGGEAPSSLEFVEVKAAPTATHLSYRRAA